VTQVLMSVWAHKPYGVIGMRSVSRCPLLSPDPRERQGMALFVGIDIGKFSHVASLLSSALLAKYGRYELCPTLAFDQSRVGFEKLLALMSKHALPDQCHVLIENTGHYGRALEQYLQEKGVQVYQVHVQTEKKKNKSDKRDAQALAVLLYNQVERGILVTNKSEV